MTRAVKQHRDKRTHHNMTQNKLLRYYTQDAWSIGARG